MSPEVFLFYKTDIPEMDSEHWDILANMQDLVHYCKKRDDRHAGPHAHALRCRFEDHIAHEERFMREIGFKFIEYHVEQHVTMKAKLDKIVAEIDAGRYPSWIVQDLRTMFINHIDHSDLQYAAFYKENGNKS